MNLDRDLRDRLEEFFGSVVEPKDYAKDMRRFMHETVGMAFATTDEEWCVNVDNIRNGYYYLNELCEILDPQLTKED